MIKKYLLILLLQIFLVPNFVLAGNSDNIRESTILFKIDSDATPSELKKLNALVNPSTILESEVIAGITVHVVKIRNIKGFEKAFSQQLEATGAVEFAEPDRIIPHALTPNDPSFGNQWHHQTINSPAAWNTVTGPSNLDAVKVCVLDTGVDTDHPDLAGNLLLPGYNTRLNLSGNVEDAHGHGSGTSGVVGAVGNNSAGVSGMVWDINIIPIQINISDTNSSAYLSDMAQGIQWCADQGGKVANLSYSGAQYATIDNAAQYLRASGGLLVMSAGNDGTFNDISTYPDYDSFVIVGATSQSDVITYFSERGPFVDVVAPGLSILTTYINAQYVYYSGTSFSSPMTAGLAALIYSVNPEFTPTQVENYIFNTAADLGAVGDDDIYGHGRIDAGAAVSSAASTTPNAPPTAVATANPTSGIVPLLVNFNGTSSDDTDGFIDSYTWFFDDGTTHNGTGQPGLIGHAYTAEGAYDATLSVTDNNGAQTISSVMTIVVSPNLTMLAPTNLSATVDTSNVTLNWAHDGSGSLQEFQIFRALKVKHKFNYSQIGTSTSTQYLDQDLELGNYRYKVRAIDTIGTITDFSNSVSVNIESTSPGPGTLEAPVLSASSSGLTVTLTWTHNCPSGSVCTYHIERGDSKIKGKPKGQINFALLASGTGLSYPVVEPGPGTYYYKVYVTTDGGSTSSDSNIVNKKLK